jgi:uncharacterized protein
MPDQVSEVSIIEIGEVKLNEPLVILGFVGPGLVGGIAVAHIVEKLKMEEIARVRSKYTPPAVIFIDGQLRHPFRIYANSEGSLCSIVCETTIRFDGAYQISSVLLDWLEAKKAKELVVLEGLHVQSLPKENRAYCAAESEKLKACLEKGIKPITLGIIQGIAGSILSECLIRKITGLAFLIPTIAFTPDPEGAALLIDALNKVYSLGINTEDLLKEAEKIRQKLKGVAESHHKIRKAEEKEVGSSEAIYT